MAITPHPTQTVTHYPLLTYKHFSFLKTALTMRYTVTNCDAVPVANCNTERGHRKITESSKVTRPNDMRMDEVKDGTIQS